MNRLWQPLETVNKINPYSMYSQLREHDPVHKSQTGEWVITKYSDVKKILTSKSFKSGNRKDWIDRSAQYLLSKDIDIREISIAINSFVLQLNPPSHDRIRRFITNNWNRKSVEDIIDRNISELLSNFKEQSFDLVKDYTSKIPSMNITAIMGLPRADYQYLHGLSSEMIKALDLYVSVKDLVQLNKAAKEFIGYFREKLQNSSFKPGLFQDLLVANQKEKDKLSEDELISILIFLFVASEETTVSFMSLACYHISEHKLNDEFQNEETISIHLEEMLRFDSPVQLLGRIAAENIEIRSREIKKGDTVTLAIGAANRDPDVFDSPDELILSRNPKHLSFGKGIHFCLGDWLARITAGKAIKAIYERFPTMAISAPPSNWYDNIAIRGFNNLPVSAKS